MTIRCKLCGYAIRSDKPDPEAQADVLEKVSKHLGKVHLPQTQEFGKALITIQGLASSYLLLTHFVDIPESEAALLASYQESRVALIGILELEPGAILQPTPKPPKASVLH